MPTKKARAPKQAKPTPAKSGPSPGERARRRRKKARARVRTTPWPTINSLLIELALRCPAVFGAWRKPLAIGINQDILTDMGCHRGVLDGALRRWTSDLRYLLGLVRDTHRYDLDGAPVADLTEEEKAKARERIPEAREREIAAKAERAGGAGKVEEAARHRCSPARRLSPPATKLSPWGDSYRSVGRIQNNDYRPFSDLVDR